MIRKLYNPEAYSKNIFQPLRHAAGCCNSANGILQEASIASGGVLNGFRYEENGEIIDVDFEAGSSNAVDQKILLQQYIRAAGYVTHTEDYGYKGNGIDVVVLGELGNSIRVAGEIKITHFKIGGVYTAATIKTKITAADAMRFEVDFGTVGGDLVLDGQTATIDWNAPDGFVSGEAEDLKAAIIDALDASGKPFDNVVVTEDGLFYVVITSFADTITLSGVTGERVTSYPAFKE